MTTNRIFTETAKFFDLLRNRQDLFFVNILSAAFLSFFFKFTFVFGIVEEFFKQKTSSAVCR